MSYSSLECFKAYDIRGKMPQQLNKQISYTIAVAYADFLKPTRVVVGYDIRLTSQDLAIEVVKGLRDSGVDVIDIGMCGTEEVYFATFSCGLDGGIMVTASHNPLDYNGMKMVRADARPISSDSGLKDIARRVENQIQPTSSTQGKYRLDTDKTAFAKYLLDFIDISQLQPLKVVVNPGNSSAGLVLDLLEPYLPFELIKICYEPDGTFPNGIPNPLLPENRSITADAVIKHQADLGIAWDGDFDRCFFFDAQGNFVEGYYIVGLLAQALLDKNPGEKIIYDPRLTWNTQEMVNKLGGKPIQSKAGHAFIKDAMRENNAIYGGEMSAHHYFRDFAYCDSGMLPWLLLTSYLSRQSQSLEQVMQAAIAAYPCSGEVNFKVADSQAVITRIKEYYVPQQPQLDTTDGLGASFDNWRFNVRASNTEPLLRLNVETRANPQLLSEKLIEITQLINEQG